LVGCRIGVDVARNIKKQGVEVDPDPVIKGTRDTFSSSGAGQPKTFKVTEAIPGFKEALKLMPRGSK